jgi:hypothetical protein
MCIASWTLKADSHIPCRSHIVPLPCRSAKALDCVFPIWFTQCGRVWFTHTMPFPCHVRNMPFWKRPLKTIAGSWQGDGMGSAWERHGMCELASAVQRRHVGDLSDFGSFLLPRGVPGSLLQEAYQTQMQVASVKQSNVCYGREEAYNFLVQGHWMLL